MVVVGHRVRALGAWAMRACASVCQCVRVRARVCCMRVLVVRTTTVPGADACAARL